MLSVPNPRDLANAQMKYCSWHRMLRATPQVRQASVGCRVAYLLWQEFHQVYFSTVQADQRTAWLSLRLCKTFWYPVPCCSRCMLSAQACGQSVLLPGFLSACTSPLYHAQTLMNLLLRELELHAPSRSSLQLQILGRPLWCCADNDCSKDL